MDEILSIKKYICIALLGIAVFLNAYDVYSTKTILENGGMEANPVVAYMMENLGENSIVYAKALFLLFLAISIQKAKTNNDYNTIILFLSIIVVYYFIGMYLVNYQVMKVII